MNTTEVNNTEILEMMQTLMNEGMQGFPTVMTRIYNLAMQFERELHLGAGKYERCEDRRGYANGYKPKTLSTHAGKLKLQIPQVRDSETPFYPRSLERGTRYERALKLAVAEMYVRGVSTRKVQAVFDKLCDVNITAEQVSRAMREMDEELEAWRNRPIGDVKVLFADATYHKARVNGVVVSVATFIIAGILADGHRAILAVDSDLSENEVHWRRVLAKLVERGMYGAKLIVSDSHDGLRAAREAILPGIPWQRCQMHLQQNAQAHVTKAELKAEVAEDIRAIFHAGSLEEAKRLLAATIEKYSKCQAKLAAWMEDNIPEGFTVFAFPLIVRQFLRTNNMEENLNKQIKSRTRLIPAFPNVESLMRLVSAICVEISDDWESSTYKYMCAIKEL
ncbi:MAG: IS256 family transposase [Bacteroidales bacterium]|nr:IS256 family transposase [Bacteroidales bacterium]